jgi:hypothetical protein
MGGYVNIHVLVHKILFEYNVSIDENNLVSIGRGRF